MILLQNLSLVFGQQRVLNDESVGIDPSWKIGLVGRNGAGKSTLLKLISGEISPDDGIITSPKGLRIGYLSQDLVTTSNRVALQELLCAKLSTEILDNFWPLHQAILHSVELEADDVSAYATYYSELSEEGFHGYEAEAISILSGLGFSQTQLKTPIQELSLGWRMRVVLGKLLLSDPDFYLFDEPTNHLDITANEWFSHFLAQSKRGYLLVSHDKHFLDKSCDKILEVELGSLSLYHTNFSSYVTQKEKLRSSLQEQAAQLERIKTKKIETANKFRATASKAKLAQQLLKEVERMEDVTIPPALPDVTFKFQQPERSGRFPLKVEDLSCGYTHELFAHATFTIEREEKVALIAPNGVGKTTLFKALTGELNPLSGEITWGYQTEVGYFEQDQVRALDGKSTIFNYLQNHCRADDQSIRNMLGCFLFSKDDVHKKIEVLSGGERNRVAMAKLLLNNPNFLLLDEPTNHLDLYAKEVLKSALKAYKGTVLVVSHDQDFIQQSTTRILELRKDRICDYSSYESYLWSKPATSKPQASNKPILPTKGKEDRVERKTAQKKLLSAEHKVTKLEKEQAKLSSQLEKEPLENHPAILKDLKRTEEMLSRAQDEWENLFAQLEQSS